jgi:hypothetical protein
VEQVQEHDNRKGAGSERTAQDGDRRKPTLPNASRARFSYSRRRLLREKNGFTALRTSRKMRETLDALVLG